MKITIKHILAIIVLCITAFVVFDNNRRNTSHRPDLKVYNKSSDNSVAQVKEYLSKYLNDPDSYEPIDWYRVINRSDGSYSVRHVYRAKNALGALQVFDNTFYLDNSGRVIDER